MDMVELMRRSSKVVFGFALMFFVLTLFALLVLGVNPGEEVVGAIILGVNLIVMAGATAMNRRARRAETVQKTNDELE